MSRNYSLESQINQATDFIKISGFSGILLSSFLLLSPAKSVGYIGVGAGMSAVGVSILSRNSYIKAVENHVNELKKEKETRLNEKTEEITTVSKQVKELNCQVKTLNKEKELQEDERRQVELELEKTKKQTNELANQCDYFRKEWEISTQRFEDSINTAKQAVSEALEEWQKKITLLASTKTDYSKLAERLIELLKEGQDVLNCYSEKLDKAKIKVNSLDDLLSIYFCLNDEMVGIKTRMIKSINTLSVQEKELDLDESYGSYEGLKAKHINLQKQYNQMVGEANSELMRLKGDCDARIQEFLVTAEKEVGKTWSENEDFFKQLKETIQALEKQVTVLSKPLEYRPAIRADMVIGNVIIRYFHALGIILDRSHSDFRTYEATLWFFVDRNQRTPLASELNEHSERLQQLSHTLNSPQFDLDPESGLIKVAIQWARKPVVIEDKIQKLFTPLEKIMGDVIKRMADDKPTVRVMGSTGDGKGVITRYLTNAILTLHQWYTRLHDPQDGSAQDHWGIPKVSKSGRELKANLKAINSQMLKRESEKNWNVVTLDILDEVDTHLEKLDKEAFIELCSRIRHCGMKLVLIGQNPKVGRAGFQWADMEQMTCIYMGSSVGNAINSSACSLYQRREKLNKEHQQVMEYLESLNDGEKYLYGLVVIPGKSPKWILLQSPEDIEIDCNPILLGESFEIPNSLMQSVEGKSSKICDNITDGKIDGNTADTSPIVGLNGSAVIADTTIQPTLLPTCKKHPEVELKPQSDGRYYCKSCKKRVPKSDLAVS